MRDVKKKEDLENNSVEFTIKLPITKFSNN